MKNGLLLGKFMPFHKGHMALIDFALANVQFLKILVCAHSNENIDGTTRYNWVKGFYHANAAVEVILLEYDETALPATSVSSREASAKWASYLKARFPATDVFISSEPYGEYVADYWNIRFLCFDIKKQIVPVSATLIRRQPFKYWDYIPPVVRSYFTKKICLAGAESTGKSVLTERLAAYYETAFVPETARDIITETNNCTLNDLYRIAAAHAKAIIETTPCANKLLFVDTDINITKSYGRFLFDTQITPEAWIEEANRFDLYLFLETDCPFVQDGTRLTKEERDKLSLFHKKQFAVNGVTYHSLKGNWEDRFTSAIQLIDKTFF